jgi:hypothetical protein
VNPLRLAALCSLFVGCHAAPDSDERHVVESDVPSSEAKADGSSWVVEESLHLGESRYGSVEAGGRNVMPMWIAGTNEQPVSVALTVAGHDGDAVRVAVLGPLEGGQRALLGAAGYDAASSTAEVTIDVTHPGQILVVVGSYALAEFASYDVSAQCANETCNAEVVDALAAPKLGGLIGTELDDGSALIQTRLNDALSAHDHFEVELWSSPPGLRWDAQLIAVSESSGTQANFLLPPGTLTEGDDLMFVVRAGDALPIAERGVWARFAPMPHVFARLDALYYSDLGAVSLSGVTGYFEGFDELSLRRVANDAELATTTLVANLPGTPGLGFGAFDATLMPEMFLDGKLDPDLPKNGETLSVGRIDGNGGYHPFGCFEFCNDLAGTGECTSQPLPCP